MQKCKKKIKKKIEKYSARCVKARLNLSVAFFEEMKNAEMQKYKNTKIHKYKVEIIKGKLKNRESTESKARHFRDQ